GWAKHQAATTRLRKSRSRAAKSPSRSAGATSGGKDDQSHSTGPRQAASKSISSQRLTVPSVQVMAANRRTAQRSSLMRIRLPANPVRPLGRLLDDLGAAGLQPREWGRSLRAYWWAPRPTRRGAHPRTPPLGG